MSRTIAKGQEIQPQHSGPAPAYCEGDSCPVCRQAVSHVERGARVRPAPNDPEQLVLSPGGAPGVLHPCGHAVSGVFPPHFPGVRRL